MLAYFVTIFSCYVTIDLNVYDIINRDVVAVYNTTHYGFPNRVMDTTDTSGTDDRGVIPVS